MSAIEHNCPRCGALPNQKCRNENGDVLPYIHLLRLQKAGLTHA